MSQGTSFSLSLLFAKSIDVDERDRLQEGHVPLTCEEADRDARMDGVHAVEGELTFHSL